LTVAATNDDVRRARLRGIAGAPALWLGAACFLVHLVANAHYDVFRDELYFIVCGLHPAFGYVDQPPLIPLIAGASFKLFGTALTSLRLVPGLAAAALFERKKRTRHRRSERPLSMRGLPVRPTCGDPPEERR